MNTEELKNAGPMFDEPKFSKEEYAHRLTRVRQEMKQQDIEVLVLFSPRSFYYMTGFESGATYFQALIITQDEMVLFLREMEKIIGEITTGMKDIVLWEDHLDATTTLVDFLKQKGWYKQRIGVEKTSQFYTVKDYEKLVALLGRTPLDGSRCLDRVRIIKSEREIDYMRRAGMLTAIGMQAAMESVGDGVSENDVAANLVAAMFRAGSEQLPSGPTISSGPMSGVPHAMFHRYTLRRGDAVLFEFSASFNAYAAPMMRSAAVLEAPTEVRKMMDACIGGLEAAIDAVRPGVTAGRVDEACRRVIEDAGYEPLFRKRTGYGIGIYKPRWSEGDLIDVKRDDPLVLEPGMAIHMPPALREYGKYGVGVSDSIVVTKSGCELLTNFDRRLYISKR